MSVPFLFKPSKTKDPLRYETKDRFAQRPFGYQDVKTSRF